MNTKFNLFNLQQLMGEDVAQTLDVLLDSFKHFSEFNNIPYQNYPGRKLLETVWVYSQLSFLAESVNRDALFELRNKVSNIDTLHEVCESLFKTTNIRINYLNPFEIELEITDPTTNIQEWNYVKDNDNYSKNTDNYGRLGINLTITTAEDSLKSFIQRFLNDSVVLNKLTINYTTP